MEQRTRDETGRYSAKASVEDVLGVFDEVRGPVVTTSDVADQLGVSTETARRKMSQLVDERVFDSRQTGRTTVYWRSEDVEPEQSLVETHPETETPGGEPTNTGLQEVEQTSVDDIDLDELLEDAVEAVSGSDNPKKREMRVEALRACYHYIEKNGTPESGPKKSEFIADLYPEHSAGYGSKGSWWNEIGNEGLKKLAERHPCLTPPDVSGVWTYDC